MPRHSRLLSLAALMVTLFSEIQAAEPVKIFILAGQSNMVGHGNMTPVTAVNTLEHLVDPANDTTGDYQFLVDGAGWKSWNDVWIHYARSGGTVKGDLTTGYGTSSGHVGPEIGFGHVASGQYENQVLIIKCAWGGKSLGNDFLPPSAESYPTPQADGDKGFYYAEILRLVSLVTGDIGAHFPGYAGQGYEIAGFGWHQGYNDRVTPAFSAAYQTNMAHFIRDMRSAGKGLDVPNLPFVIVTTAMDGNGPEVYTQVEMAQRAMTNPYLTSEEPADLYPDFVGSVAVVDARKTYNGLQFWYPVQESPVSEGHHWNRNAKTYVNIGLAMGDAMSGLSPGRCPSRLRASGVASGIELTWQNGEETPTSVQIIRNGVEIAAAAPVSPAGFIDTTALPGIYEYELNFTMPGDPCEPLTLTFDGSIRKLLAFRSPTGISLTWENPMSYAGIEVRRDGLLLEANLTGDATSFTDTSAPTSGLITYTVNPTTGTSTAASSQINLNGLPSGNALIYEPFDYAVGGLSAKSGVSEVGLAGSWTANSTTLVTPGTLGYGQLPVGGGKLSDFSGGQNRFGGTRGINASALADQDMLDDGKTLWFSLIVGYDTGGNLTNSRLGFALANSSFSGGNNKYWITDEGAQLGSGVGIYLGRIGGINGRVVATRFRDLASGDGANGNILGSWTGVGKAYGEGTHGLIVGKITWAADPADPDTIELYQPETDLLLPASPSSVLTTTVSQVEFDTITFARGDKVVLDEIRFGKSYDSVIGKRSFADWIAGYPGVAGQTAFADDPDGDGLENGLENYLGTDPGSSSQGLIGGQITDNALTFSHPISATPADDITAFYTWSTDLVTFHADGATLNGTTVTFSKGIPSGGMVGVSADISGTVPERVFARLEVAENP